MVHSLNGPPDDQKDALESFGHCTDATDNAPSLLPNVVDDVLRRKVDPSYT